ncbi:ribosomal protein L18e/L15P [Macrophomina phaseolina]|uniref:Ribosomal protein L18e/L15P n=1 Tax=Macrophomina phaseolina TaxID=35725 RepID=A0ABQ8FW08_9PEZI|nr:ribosomal protein L18e/L15P [Macrophomina phaseolina]
MPPRFTNTRKHRGHVSASYGRIGKHCKHPGDRGLAGGQKLSSSKVGKVGVRCFHKTQQQFWKPVLNLGKAGRQENVDAKPTEEAPVVGILSFGYTKLLGKGCTPNFPIIAKARYARAEVERTIKEADGLVQLVVQGRNKTISKMTET